MSPEEKRAARNIRAAARRSSMMVDVVPLGRPKLSPYADSTPEERSRVGIGYTEAIVEAIIDVNGLKDKKNKVIDAIKARQAQ